MTGPPASPCGSMPPSSHMSRLVSVGPMTAQWEGVREGRVEAEISLGVVAHGERAVHVAVGGDVGEQPAVHRALVPGRVLVAPVARQRRDPGGACGAGGTVPRV